MGTGGLLDVEPSELKFLFEVSKQSSCSMNLSNKSDQYVAFKVKTTNPKRYCVRPNAGIVLPRSTCDVTVTMQAQKEVPPNFECKDKFLLQCVVADEGATTKEITQEMFNKQPGKVVDEFKLRVVFTPADPPTPVPEESEEGHWLGSSFAESGNQNSSLLDKVSTSPDGTMKEKNMQEFSLISKLREEKNSVIELNQKLRQELDLLRKESSSHGRGFSILFVILAGLLGIISGYFMKKK